MNIIFTTISMRGGGTERVISILANRLVDRGHNVTILMIADPTIAPSEISAIFFACSGVEMPKPIAQGMSVSIFRLRPEIAYSQVKPTCRILSE